MSEDNHIRVAVSGASGLIGQRLTSRLSAAGCRVDPLVRHPPRPGTTEIRWDPGDGAVDARGLAGVNAVVHLAGENIGRGRWTQARMEAIRDSRVIGTALLSECLANLRPRPDVLAVASAVGYYGDRGDEVLTEASRPGESFLAEVCRQWEGACEPARKAGIRVVNLRFGMVLAADGGALARMLAPFRWGVGGRIGSGRQYMSWVSLTDVARAIEQALKTDSLGGPVNVTAPNPVRNAEFTRVLGHVLGRPTLLPLPAFAVRLIFGQMGRELLLASARAVPEKLAASGFSFEHPGLEAALRAELGLSA